MGARTNYYVDPAIAANSGTGTIGDPFGDLQYALNTVTRDATNGDQFNIKAGTAEVLSSALTLATYGNPHSGSFTAPLVFRGYTAAANDGGIGEITCGGSNISVMNAFSSVHWLDMKLGNCGTTWVLGPANTSVIHNCELHTAAYGIMNVGGTLGMLIAGCYLHGLTTDSINLEGHSSAIGNYIAQSAGTAAINLNGASTLRLIERNIISVSGGVIGVRVAGYYSRVIANSILSAGGTGTGISALSDFGAYGAMCINNLVEGFSGVGGKGIQWNATSGHDALMFLCNAAFNCTTAYTLADQKIPDDSSNETLSATPFSKSGSDTFANRMTYFAPASTGSVLTGAYPTGSNLPKGAVGKVGGGLLPLRRGIAA